MAPPRYRRNWDRHRHHTGHATILVPVVAVAPAIVACRIPLRDVALAFLKGLPVVVAHASTPIPQQLQAILIRLGFAFSAFGRVSVTTPSRISAVICS